MNLTPELRRALLRELLDDDAEPRSSAEKLAAGAGLDGPAPDPMLPKDHHPKHRTAMSTALHAAQMREARS